MPLEKAFGVGFIHVLPSSSRSIQKRNLWQPYFPEVAVFSQVMEVLRRLFKHSSSFFLSVESQMSSA